ncbi:MAG TPA: OmpA family protein [Nitrospiraceae bacterium]|nr:OmpA family protein [Nitrospiraceae bacterium]
MGYVRVDENESPLGFFGCSQGCGCQSCSSARPTLAEWYVRDDEESEPEPRRTPNPSNSAGTAAGRSAGPRIGGYFGEPRPTPSGPVTAPPIHSQPVPILDRFEFRNPALRPSIHQPVINLMARQVAASWQTASPIRTIRLIGHTDAVGPRTFNLELGRQRALTVRQALMQALDRIRPGLSRQMTLVPQSVGETQPRFDNRIPEGRSRNRRVEVLFSTMPAAPVSSWPTTSKASVSRPLSPPPVRIPSPAEAAQRIMPFRPETPDERVQRILRTPIPPPPPRRSFDQMLWTKVNEGLDSTMSRAGVPPSLRGPIRDAARVAIERGAESALDNVLDKTNLDSETKEAIKTTVRALGQVPRR